MKSSESAKNVIPPLAYKSQVDSRQVSSTASVQDDASNSMTYTSSPVTPRMPHRHATDRKHQILLDDTRHELEQRDKDLLDMNMRYYMLDKDKSKIIGDVAKIERERDTLNKDIADMRKKFKDYIKNSNSTMLVLFKAISNVLMEVDIRTEPINDMDHRIDEVIRQRKAIVCSLLDTKFRYKDKSDQQTMMKAIDDLNRSCISICKDDRTAEKNVMSSTSKHIKLDKTASADTFDIFISNQDAFCTCQHRNSSQEQDMDLNSIRKQLFTLNEVDESKTSIVDRINRLVCELRDQGDDDMKKSVIDSSCFKDCFGGIYKVKGESDKPSSVLETPSYIVSTIKAPESVGYDSDMVSFSRINLDKDTEIKQKPSKNTLRVPKPGSPGKHHRARSGLPVLAVRDMPSSTQLSHLVDKLRSVAKEIIGHIDYDDENMTRGNFSQDIGLLLQELRCLSAGASPDKSRQTHMSTCDPHSSLNSDRGTLGMMNKMMEGCSTDVSLIRVDDHSAMAKATNVMLNCTSLLVKSLAKLLVTIGLKDRVRETITSLTQRNLYIVNEFYKVKSIADRVEPLKVEKIIELQKGVLDDLAHLMEMSTCWITKTEFTNSKDKLFISQIL